MSRRSPMPSLPPTASAGAQACSVLATSSLLGDFWTLAVLRCVVYGLRRYADIQRELGTASNVLADRLQRLVEAGVLTREPYQQRPLRHEYGLTPAGQELATIVLALKQWGDDHLQPAGPYTRLEHEGCSGSVEVSVSCRVCGGRVGLDGLHTEVLRQPI